MSDEIDIVGDRVAYWSNINFPNVAPFTFQRDKSSMTVTPVSEEVAYQGNLVPVSVAPVTVETASWENGTSIQDEQTFTVNEQTT